MNNTRIALASVISPLIAISIFSVGGLFYTDKPLEVLWWVGILLIFGFPLVAVVGLPGYLLLNKYKFKSIYSYGIAGIAGGLVASAVVILPIAISGLRYSDLSYIPNFVYSQRYLAYLIIAMSLITALIFWFIGIRNNKG